MAYQNPPNLLNPIFGMLLMSLTLLSLQGCSTPPKVIAVTGTNIGVELTQNPATQTPQAKLGYQRSEIALVPTNRRLEDPPTGEITGAEETAEVLMELKYAGIFSWGDSGGIYQRLAVGKTAVTQPGAAVMFARNVTGDVEKEAGMAAANAAAEVTTFNMQRGEGFLDENVQVRVSNVIDKINLLSEEKVKNLLANPPVADPDAQALVTARLGNKTIDGLNEDEAKGLLRTMAVYSKRNIDQLQKWEAAVTASQ